MIGSAGGPAVTALNAVTPRAGRRLSILHAGGELGGGRSADVLAVVGKYGDRAADFVWDHKGALAVAAVLATFLADPEPYLTGAKELGVVAVREAAAVPQALAAGAAAGADWTVVGVAAVAAAGGLAAWRLRRARG